VISNYMCFGTNFEALYRKLLAYKKNEVKSRMARTLNSKIELSYGFNQI